MTDHLTIARSGMPGQLFIKCRGKAYRSAILAEAFTQAMWITPDMTLIERLQRHLDSGTVGTVRAGKSGIGSVDTMPIFVTLYCPSPLSDTGAHGMTFDEALRDALDKLDAKIGARLPVTAAPLGLPVVRLPGLVKQPTPLPLPKGLPNA